MEEIKDKVISIRLSETDEKRLKTLINYYQEKDNEVYENHPEFRKSKITRSEALYRAIFDKVSCAEKVLS